MPWIVGKKKDQSCYHLLRQLDRDHEGDRREKKMLLHVNQHSPMPNNEDKKLNRQKLQDRLKDIHGKLYRTARGSDRYLYSDNKRTLCNQTGVEVDGRIRAVRGLVT
ncbi:hypothetical protein M3Y96_01087600 [Aphelenchoides besseyi]|nr:hypothetical protein M3Y96_01087600 [Aphelenchoides besseyi]